MKLFLKTIILLSILIASYFIYNSYFTKEESVIYETRKAKIMDIKQSIDTIGEIFPIHSVDVGSEVSGQIKKLYVKVGDIVKKGDKIANIDDVKQKNELENQKATLKIYQAKLNSNKIAYEIARKKYSREKILFNKNATSKDSLENAQNSYTQAKSNLQEIKALLSQTKISLQTAKTNLGYTKITAPISGTILAISAKEGQTLNVNQSTPNIVAIANLDLLEVKMKVSQGDINKVQTNQKVVFNILSNDKKFHSNITSIDPANTTISDNTSISYSSSSSSAVYYYAKYRIKNNNDIFKIGMTTQNKIILKEVQNALTIPFSAIKRKQNKTFVDILENDKVKKKEISLGIDDGINIEVTKGLSKDDDIIIPTSLTKEANVEEQALFL